jgi:ArsR family transcriptional regulator
MDKLSTTSLYRCLADPQRLRILHLLQGGCLCVCHLQEILEEKQATVSKHLQYLRNLGLVTARRQGKWMYYSLSTPVHPVLQVNLTSLDGFGSDFAVFEADAERRWLIAAHSSPETPAC